jgi:hypothetical protein
MSIRCLDDAPYRLFSKLMLRACNCTFATLERKIKPAPLLVRARISFHLNPLRACHCGGRFPGGAAGKLFGQLRARRVAVPAATLWLAQR